MRKFIFSQYLLVAIRNIFGILLIPLLDSQQLGLYKLFGNITNNSRFLHFGIPAFSVYRSTAKNTKVINAYEKLIYFANILSLIFIVPYAVILSSLYDVLDIIFIMALLLQILAILINNILSALERIKGNLLLYSLTSFLPHIALILSPVLYLIKSEIDFGKVLICYSVINLFFAVVFAYIRKPVTVSAFRNSIPKLSFLFRTIKSSLFQIIFSLLFAINMMFDNYLIINNYSLAFLGSFSVYLVYNSLFAQFYSAFTVYTFKHKNNMYAVSNLILLKILLLTACAGLIISYFGSIIVIQLLEFFPTYQSASELIDKFWWVTSLMVFRFNLPNHYFKNGISYRLIRLFIITFLIKIISIFYFGSSVYIYIILFDPLLSLLILSDYLVMKIRSN